MKDLVLIILFCIIDKKKISNFFVFVFYKVVLLSKPGLPVSFTWFEFDFLKIFIEFFILFLLFDIES